MAYRGTLDYEASDEEINRWIKGLGLFVSDAECSDEAVKCTENIADTGCTGNEKIQTV